jgi:pilus assembly protein CpaF
MPDEKSDNILRLIKESDYILIPYMSDAISAKKAIIVSQEYSSISANINFITLKLNTGHDFCTDKILNMFEIFKDSVQAAFNFQIQEHILSPKFSYRDKSNSYVSALENIISVYDSKIKTLNVYENSYYSNENVYKELKESIQAELVEAMKDCSIETDSEKLRQNTKNKTAEIIKKRELNIPKDISDKLYKELCDDIAGFGVLEDFLKDSLVTEMMVNGYDSIFIEKAGKISKTNVSFTDEKKVKNVIERIVARLEDILTSHRLLLMQDLKTIHVLMRL